LEFRPYSETFALLGEQGVTNVSETDERIELTLADGDDIVRIRIGAGAESDAGDTRQHIVERDRLPGVVEHIIHKLHLSQVLLFPVEKWRRVFDVVAFSLAENEDWQAVDAEATVELNTRDPLLCDHGDFQTLIALIGALLQDAESEEEGLQIVAVGAPVVIRVVPTGHVEVAVGNAVLADEVAEVV
jgi:hypothetical protein